MITTIHLIMLAIVTIYIIFQYIFAIRLKSFLKKQSTNADKRIMRGIWSLIIGDTIHAVYLYFSYFNDDIWLNGYGVYALMITSVMMPLLYFGVFLFTIHEYRNGKWQPTHYLAILFLLLRIILAVLPQNNYATILPPTDIRVMSNISFSFFGLISLSLLFGDSKSRGREGDKILKKVVYAGLISFLCYIGHLLLYPINPLFGILMLPKSIAYNFVVYYFMKGIMTLRK